MPRRATRTTRAKAPPTSLSPEEQQARDQCDLLLKDFDKQCGTTKAEAAREAKTAMDSISTIFKLEMMKIPMETKALMWQEYYEQHAGPAALRISQAVAEAVDDSVMEAVESQVSQIKSAIESTTVKKGRRKKKEPFSDENEPQTLQRTSSRRRVASKTLSDTCFETPATTSRTRSVLETPANTRYPLGPLQTPMITPKFDTMSLSRTVSRVAKAGEVLVSLSGSPVAPSVGPRTKAGKEITGENALIPLGGGNTLNMPLAGADLAMDVTAELDSEQMARLELLHRNLGNMLKLKAQNMTMNASSTAT